MLKLHLVLYTRSDDMVELALPMSFRVTFGIISVVLIAAILSFGMITVVPMVVTAITVLAGLYEERWIFDRARGTVTHRYGLVFLAGKHETSFDEIESFILSNFREVPDEQLFSSKRTLALRSLVSLQMGLKGGRSRTIEIRANRHNSTLKESAERISQFCGIPLEYVA